jgi:hypothetical protein
LKGYKIAVTFPADVLTFLEGVCKKLTKIPIIDPRTKKPLTNPENGKMLYLSNTGGIEELIHSSILATLLPYLYQHEAFEAERPKLEKFREDYGKYLTTMIESHLIKEGVTHGRQQSK